EGEAVPGRFGVTGEVHGRAVLTPRTRRRATPVVLEGRPEPGQVEAPQPFRIDVFCVQLVDPAVWRETRHADEAVGAAPVEPPLADTLLLERPVQREPCSGLILVAPVEAVTRRRKALRRPLQLSAGGRLGLRELR